ncbi:Membrane dipeptidase (Peptidase family M19) [Rhizoctonia solani]|uniref:Dipeptidase n=1 Tax=Rhizoctonia solani TaxID=456999 RepID=A0A8H8NVF2_9AGAM|nr:Membrane dipeptidase (Peptidase family M19) [Rhizoctonia solani]QRW19477.1 Membrane dipeptidase (Peptidase family M19) [Rhizoctonia solani]
MPSPTTQERAPLLPSSHSPDAHGLPATDPDTHAPPHKHTSLKITLSSLLTLLLISAIVALVTWFEQGLPSDPEKAALAILESAPVIIRNTKIVRTDLPELVRVVYKNNITAFDLRERMPAHVDIPRIRKGRVGGFFWSVYVGCKVVVSLRKKDDGPDFLVPTNRVRDTLEQIDVAKLLIQQYPETFLLATSTVDIKEAFRVGKVASLIGVEGGHQLGNSLAVLRQYQALGARYLTLTHSCNNAFADSAGISTPVPPTHGGLSKLGEDLVFELNRLGMLVDLSHTSDETAVQALQLSRAPVIWSHSSARAGKKDGVVMINFSSGFVANPGNASVAVVADHVEHIGRVAGRKHVGIGSDYDGVSSTPVGLEDISTYPALFAELLRRGWTRSELIGLASGNLLRVLEGAEVVARQLSRLPPSMARYQNRTDL